MHTYLTIACFYIQPISAVKSFCISIENKQNQTPEKHSHKPTFPAYFLQELQEDPHHPPDDAAAAAAAPNYEDIVVVKAQLSGSQQLSSSHDYADPLPSSASSRAHSSNLVCVCMHKKSFHTLTVTQSSGTTDKQCGWKEKKSHGSNRCGHQHFIHSIQCVLPGVVCMFIQFIQFNVCYLVLFVCLLAKQANIETTPGNTH